MAWYDDIGSWFSGAGDTVSGWFGGGDTPSYGGYDDPGLTALINASNRYDTGFSDLPTQYSTPLAQNEYLRDTGQDLNYLFQPQQQSSEPFGWKQGLSFGAGALGMLGNWYQKQQEQEALEEQMKAQQEKMRAEQARWEAQTALEKEKQRLAEQEFGLKERESDIGAGTDFAKMHALAQIIQDRQGINLDPSLAYRNALLEQRGLSPQGAAGFPGVDIGGALQASDVAAAKQRALNEALGLTHPQNTNVAMNRGGLYDYAHGGYAGGGGYNMGGAMRGALSFVHGGSGGQEDNVNAALSHGEYVVDSDVVSALGDGNTEAGARKLDEMRENVRLHKRSAGKKSIPPKAKSPERYMRGGK